MAPRWEAKPNCTVNKPGMLCAQSMNQSSLQFFFALRALQHILSDSIIRTQRVLSHTAASTATAILLIPSICKAQAEQQTFFHAQQSNDSAVQQDVLAITELFDFRGWQGQAHSIRRNNNRAQCFGNLSLALQTVGAISAYEASGASGALSLLPTAGALIGAPAKELWSLYKLTPIAGVLSMLLSLGGNIVPQSSSDYEIKQGNFQYGGFVATSSEAFQDDDDVYDPNGSEVQQFASRVERRGRELRGSRKGMTIAFGMLLQSFWLAVLMAACWFTEQGGIVVWWCQAWGWMHAWYLMVALSSLLENVAGSPFTTQYTIRVSRAPKVRISPDAPSVLAVYPESEDSSLDQRDHRQSRVNPFRSSSPPPPPPKNGNHVSIASGFNQNTTEHRRTDDGTLVTSPMLTHIPTTKDDYDDFRYDRGKNPPLRSYTAALKDLEEGYNTTGRIIIDPEEPSAHARTPFYVIISVEEVSKPHAMLRVVSKAISVGAFAAGTALFASTAFITISVALTTLCLVLGAGVFGRVVAMWMASEMMKTKPVLHKVVKDKRQAAEYINHVLAIPGLTFETMGHVIVDGKCVARFNHWLRWSTYVGVLAPPYDITRLARIKYNKYAGKE